MTTSEPSALPKRTSPAGFAFWLGMIVGGGVALYGAVNLIEGQRSSLRSIAIWFVGGALALDLVIVPAAAGAGWVVQRRWKARNANFSWPLIEKYKNRPVCLMRAGRFFVIVKDNHWKSNTFICPFIICCFSPQEWYSIIQKMRVARHYSQTLYRGLGNEHSVEWVAMVERKIKIG